MCSYLKAELSSMSQLVSRTKFPSVWLAVVVDKAMSINDEQIEKKRIGKDIGVITAVFMPFFVNKPNKVRTTGACAVCRHHPY
jgi:hypothetical protein